MDQDAASSAGDLTIAIVGAGRLGYALVGALREAGLDVLGPFGRGYVGGGDAPDVVLLCVPDAEIPAAAAALSGRDGLLVGHCSGATSLSAIGGHEALSVHPLMTIPREGAVFRGAVAAVDGSTHRALIVARSLAERLGMTSVQVRDEDRVAYHAAAALASNQVLPVLDLAQRLADSVGLRREQLAPIVRATVENWVATGAEAALTGPVVRGDEAVIRGHREAVSTRAPADLLFYEELLAATRRLAGRVHAETAGADPTDPSERES